MDGQEYDAAARRVAELVDKEQKYDEAVAILETLIKSDLPDVDRAVMCINMATVCDKMGHEDHALQWYDYGIALEEPHLRTMAQIHKAGYLAGKGRKDEALAIFQRLAEAPFFSLSERDNMKHNISVLRGEIK